MKKLTLSLVSFLSCLIAFSQVTEYIMADTLVTSCDGRLFDSGSNDEVYGINENLTFTVCTESAISINFQNEFCVEEGFDFLSVYDGPDVFSPALALNLSGTEIPANLVAASGCVTFNFSSDGSTSYCGFDIVWNSQNIEPVPPALTLLNDPSCGSELLNIVLDEPILCSEIYLENSILTGQEAIPINGFVPLNCNENGLASEFELLLDLPLVYNCNFNLNLEIGVLDNCDSIWLFNQNLDFIYSQCEIPVEIIVGEEMLCNDQCTSISAQIDGCFSYLVEWNNGLPEGSGPYQICPEGPLTYTVNVTEVETGVTGFTSFTFEHESVVINEEDLFLCQNRDPFTLTTNVLGGTWEGPGIDDEDVGLFDPNNANLGENIIYYEIDSSTCYDSLLISITEINAGDISAACPNVGPTQLMPTPPGGVWSGNEITPDGIYNPTIIGVFTLTYEVNGCTDELFMDVRPFNSAIDITSICQSANTQYLDTRPVGGLWSGPGIDDGLLGTWEPEDTGSGGLITLTYEAIGCSIEHVIDVIPAQIGGRYSNTCPFTDPYLIDENPNPAGGIYSGEGIQDANTGLFDPSSVPPDNWYEILYEAPNGCVDTIDLWVVDTTIPEDTVYFCEAYEPLFLNNDNTGRYPWGGQWSGPGIMNIENNDFDFTPALSGVGEHTIYYSANTCVDSIIYIVYPDELNEESILSCSADADFTLQELPTGATWTGNGIIDDISGIFSPSLVPGEVVNIIYTSPPGCSDEIEITIDEFIQAELSALEENYCFISAEQETIPAPEGGFLDGPTGDGVFTPSLLGTGIYTYNYGFPDYSCSADTSITFEIFPEAQVSLEAAEDILCAAEGTTLSAEAISGIPDGTVTLEWSDGLIPINTHNVSPENDKYYYITAYDGCSDPVTDSVFISVLEEISLSYEFGDTLCFDELGASVNLTISPESGYEIYWNEELGFSLFEGWAGEVLDVEVIDTTYGCSSTDVVLLPSYSPISANFSLNPNLDCIPFEDNPVSFIDISQNAVTGTWFFGNETFETYDGSSPSVEYTSAGYYDILLVVENEGGCIDSASTQICINDPSILFVPDIFSPNDDGANDELYVRGQGILKLEFSVYNNWGERVFYTEDESIAWDGKVRGVDSPSGVYVYHLVARVTSGEEIIQTGDITIVR